MTIKMVNVDIKQQEIDAVTDVLISGNLASGSKVSQFENDFAEFHQVRHAIATNNGTTALHTALLAAGIGRGDEVIVPSFSFIATATAVSMTGAKPVFADVDYNTFCIDPNSIESRLNSKTKAIIGVHLFGQPFDVERVEYICRKMGIILIEDAAQSHGAAYNDKPVGGFGHMGCFSFYATKNMTTGEGGMITTNFDNYDADSRMLINHGQSQKYLHTKLGYNYRMTDIAAAIGIVQLKKLDRYNMHRQCHAEIYNNTIDVEGLLTPVVGRANFHVYHQYVLRVTKDCCVTRDEFVKYLNDNGIPTAIHYPIPIHRQPIYDNSFIEYDCPISEELAMSVFSIPVHPGIKDHELEHICHIINKVKK